MSRRLAMRRSPLVVALAAAGLVTCVGHAPAALAQTQTPLTIQIINDSGVADGQVYLLLGGQAITLGNGTVLPFSASNIVKVDTSSASPNVTAGPLACPPPVTPPPVPPPVPAPPPCVAPTNTGTTVVSPYSGATLPVYAFTAATVGSGTLYVSYNTAITYTSAPTVATLPRWQLFEMSYSASIASVGDLTSIDFFGIPIEMTTFAAGDTAYTTPVAKATYYSSTLTLLNALAALNANMTSAMLDISGNTFTPGTSALGTFARVVGPNQMAAPGSAVVSSNNGSPYPYPSFADYLDGLVKDKYTFIEKDDAVISGYVFDYTGTITGNRTSGYQIALTGTTKTDSTTGLPSNATLTLNLPAQSSANGGFDFYIYGAVQSCDSMAVAGFACTTTSLPTMANSVYGWMQADVMSALNFGYMNGKSDRANAQYYGGKVTGNSQAWYGLPPIAYPFGAARATNDGKYNPWAATMYNHSDAYGFAFSDRNGRPSPGIALPTGGTLRLWLLPDTRLDAPLVTASGATCTSTAAASCSVTLQWPLASGATGYDLVVTPPFAGTKVTVPQPATGKTVSTKLSSLDPGTNYTITAKAKNTSGTPTVESTTLVTQVAMPGTPPAPAGGNTSFVLGFNWDVPAYPQPSLQPAAGPTLPGSSAAFAVWTGGSAVQMSFLPNSTTAQGASNLSVTLPNPSAGPSTLALPFVVSFHPGVTGLSTPTGDCPGVEIANGQIVMPAGTTIPYAGCTLTVGAIFGPGGLYAATSSTYQLANGISQPPTIASIHAGSGSVVKVTPDSQVPGTASVLQAWLPNTGAVFNTLSSPFTINAPAGVTFSALTPQPAPPCPGLVVTPTAITLPIGTAIPPGSGCYIGANVTATTQKVYVFHTPTVTTVQMQGPTITMAGGTYTYNGNGSYGFASGTRPAINTNTVVALPVQISIGSEVIWSDLYYLDFVGSPTSFTVPIGVPGTPNLLVRSAGPLTVNGTAPYSTNPPNQATIGTAFAPIPDKLFAPVVMPAK